MAEKVIFDKSDFANRLGNNTQLMEIVVSEFLKEVSGLVPKLGECIKSQAWQDTGRLAHRIKGASAEVSAKVVREDARKIEDAVKADNISSIPESFASLEVHYQLLVNELSEHFSV